MASVTSCFSDLPDPRGTNARHELDEILFIALCAVLCGAEDCSDMALFGQSKEAFLRRFLSLPHGIPSHDTFSRVFRHLDPAAFHDHFLSFMSRFAEQVEGVVAVDGKTLRRSYDRAAAKSPLHLVSVWAADQRLVLGQRAVDEKSNEITAVPELLKLLSLSGVTVTADAMHCQRALSQQITEEGGHYALAVKDNQRALLDDVQFMMETASAGEPHVDSGHGRVESRQATVITDIDWLQSAHQWPGLKAVGRITRRRELAEQATEETADYLLSDALSPDQLIEVTRQHWGIENHLHWVLDVTMQEDQNRSRRGHSAENLALLRRLALNVAKLEPSKGSMKGKRKQAGWNDDYLLALIRQFAQLR
ncbi:ISAs1 family transposase [Halomonas piscis]|uniref:ISAs1 family transposase n=1 Tax=Halomonas piscis TaxID=3031727 RepID=A0ABY9Z1C3_9GAMM|nr:ISAs1 family transposase [Halomonas piscis]WNK19134.1 ISAs1 family transposase [Halomonas piscis]WNK20481.1 ISAs1 family transposase [Halomonas piscis]